MTQGGRSPKAARRPRHPPNLLKLTQEGICVFQQHARRNSVDMFPRLGIYLVNKRVENVPGRLIVYAGTEAKWRRRQKFLVAQRCSSE